MDMEQELNQMNSLFPLEHSPIQEKQVYYYNPKSHRYFKKLKKLSASEQT